MYLLILLIKLFFDCFTDCICDFNLIAFNLQPCSGQCVYVEFSKLS